MAHGFGLASEALAETYRTTVGRLVSHVHTTLIKQYLDATGAHLERSYQRTECY